MTAIVCALRVELVAVHGSVAVATRPDPVFLLFVAPWYCRVGAGCSVELAKGSGGRGGRADARDFGTARNRI